MNDAALLDSLHAALRNPDLAWYTEFHAGESIVAGCWPRSGRTREPYSRTGP